MSQTKPQPTCIVTLDDEYLSNVVLAGELPQAKAEQKSPAPAPTAEPTDVTDNTTKVYCRVSDVWLESAAALREHCRSDWYRFNLQRSTKGLPPVAEAAVNTARC